MLRGGGKVWTGTGVFPSWSTRLDEVYFDGRERAGIKRDLAPVLDGREKWRMGRS